MQRQSEIEWQHLILLRLAAAQGNSQCWLILFWGDGHVAGALLTKSFSERSTN